MVPHESALFSRGCTPTSLWGCPLSGHCEGVCTSGTMGYTWVCGSPRDIRWEEGVPKALICMHFHGVLLGSQHEMWSKQHNGKVRLVKPVWHRPLLKQCLSQ